MPQIKIKTSHVQRLKELGVYDQWLENMKLSMIDDGTIDRNLSKDTFQLLIMESFSWYDTTEGYSFWFDIAYKYND